MNNTIQDKHEAIKSRINIVDIIGQFERLTKRGQNYFCKCPFHNENTASFTVSQAKGIYKCFGCGVAGDAIKFIQEHLKLDYLNAMKWLGDFYRMPIDESSPRTFSRPRPVNRQISTVTALPPSYIPKDIFNRSLSQYSENNLVKFLHTLFEPCIVNMLKEKYYIGTSKYYPGGCIFWQVDETGNIRTGKIMPYSPETGKRDRQTTPAANWVHSVLKMEPFNLHQCFFGQHLLSDPDSYRDGTPIAIVESEKTAVIASVFIPSFIWIASGGKENLTREKCQCLAGRKVVLFPDLGALDDWQRVAGELSDITSMEVNDLLQTAATEYQLPDKSDLCDYLTSEAARTELINEFKAALIQQAPQTISEGIQIWLDFSDKGLRRKDCSRAISEIKQEYDFDSTTKEITGLKSNLITA